MSSLFGIGAGGTSEFYSYKIDNSLRFDDGSTANLSKTLDSGGNRQIWTFSAWVKRTDLTSTFPVLLGTFVNTQNYGLIRFDSSGKINIVSKISDANGINLSTTALHRDTSAWYHIMVAVDTTQSTNTDRVKLYVNVNQITNFSTSTFPSENYNTIFNYNILHYIGRYGGSTTGNFDGYMAQVHLVDGLQLTPSSFGESKSGIWIPKDTSGLTYGTNGFRLEFKQTGDGSSTASAATKGADTSGQGNHFNDHNLNAFDVMPDCPTNNFPTLNPQLGRAITTYIDPRHGNLEIDTNSSGRGTTFSTMAMPTGTGEKYYAEYRYKADSGHMRVGIISVDQANQYLETNNFDSPTTDNVSYTSVTGKIAVNGSQVEVVATYTAGDVIGMAVDLENGTIQFSKNGSNVR